MRTLTRLIGLVLLAGIGMMGLVYYGLCPIGASEAASPALAEPAAVVERFQKALQAGDTQGAIALLDPQVTIFESGYVEHTRDEYARHHLGADAAFLKHATITQMSRSGDAVGDLAWVGSASRLTTEAEGKPIDMASTETMILKKTAAGWRIVHIHWSSHANKKGG